MVTLDRREFLTSVAAGATAGAAAAAPLAARRAVAGRTAVGAQTDGTSLSHAMNHPTFNESPTTSAGIEGNSHGKAHRRIAGRSTHGNAPPGRRCFRSTTSPRWTVVTNARADVGGGGISSSVIRAKLSCRTQTAGQGRRAPLPAGVREIPNQEC
jgi:hypothetical protein